MSPGRRWARSRGATARSSSSPAWWPRLSLISLKWSRSRKRIPTGVPETVARFSASASESTKLRRFGRPVSESCRTRWRRAWSAAWRSIASARTFAEACTKWTSCGVKRLGSVEWTSRTPKGCVLALDHDREAAADAEHPQRGRHREAALVRPVVDDHVQAGLDRGAGMGVAGGGDALRGADRPGPRGRRAGGAGARRARAPRCRRRRRRRSRSSARPRPPSAPRGRRPAEPSRRAGRRSPAGRRRAAAPARRSCAR